MGHGNTINCSYYGWCNEKLGDAAIDRTFMVVYRVGQAKCLVLHLKHIDQYQKVLQ
jgi:hypothetical protein